jgi:hypothetical protein
MTAVVPISWFQAQLSAGNIEIARDDTHYRILSTGAVYKFTGFEVTKNKPSHFTAQLVSRPYNESRG